MQLYKNEIDVLNYIMPYYSYCSISRVLMRNLFLGYFHTPKTKRADVLRLMGSVLGLSREDVDKVRDSLTHIRSIHMSNHILIIVFFWTAFVYIIRCLIAA